MCTAGRRIAIGIQADERWRVQGLQAWLWVRPVNTFWARPLQCFQSCIRTIANSTVSEQRKLSLLDDRTFWSREYVWRVSTSRNIGMLKSALCSRSTFSAFINPSTGLGRTHNRFRYNSWFSGCRWRVICNEILHAWEKIQPFNYSLVFHFRFGTISYTS